MKQQTKEQLIAENAALKAKVAGLEARIAAIRSEETDNDETLRLNLSNALGSGFVKKQYSYDSNERYVYNWYEIFREVGKLLERKKQTDLESVVADLRERQDQLFSQWRKWQQDRPVNPEPPFSSHP